MKNTRNQLIYSFNPVTAKSPGILILGSIPGKESLRKQEYYGHPRNSFWKILSLITGIACDMDNYLSKISLIKEADLALWDVCRQAVRKTSLDADIVDEQPNPLNRFIREHPSLKKIVFNGQTAARLYKKYFTKQPFLVYETLLSTSPANAQYTFEQKLENWENTFKEIKNHTGDNGFL